MKKIIICLLLVLTFIFIFSACSLTEFHKVHVIEANKCFEIKNLVISYGTCDVELKNGERLYLSQGTYILVQDKCPICDHE